VTITRSDFFEDFADSMALWVSAVSDALTKPDADLVWTEEQEPYLRLQRAFGATQTSADDVQKVLTECLRGFAVSMLTAMDGGTALAKKGRIYLVDGARESAG